MNFFSATLTSALTRAAEALLSARLRGVESDVDFNGLASDTSYLNNLASERFNKGLDERGELDETELEQIEIILPFSFSSSFSLFAWSSFKPPYSFRQR
jgi:hypothetical protein